MKTLTLSPEFAKWSGVLWKVVLGEPIAYCIDHKHRLEIVNEFGRPIGQDSNSASGHLYLLCPVDNAQFQINGESFWTMQRRYQARVESSELKNATYRDLDNIYTPVLKVEPKPKDERYSIQVEIDNTSTGKKLVIYAMDRQNPSEKTQIFIDPETDKITFDSGDLHPNMIFSKVEAYFKDSKSATLEQD